MPLFNPPRAGHPEHDRPKVAPRLMRGAELARDAVVAMLAQVDRGVTREVNALVVATGQAPRRGTVFRWTVTVGALREPRGQKIGHREPEPVRPGVAEHGMPCGD